MAALIAAAEQRHLGREPYWQTLLHYGPSWRGRRSLVDDPRFFLAPTGATDPQAELAATLRALFAPAPPPPAEHAVCRFPARLAWLQEQLGFAGDELPVAPCQELTVFLERTQPRAVTLVYPAAYMNSPASLFGHTLIAVQSEFDSPLLNHAVNYAALTRERNGIVFALKGVIGSYPGYYSLMPYYRMVRLYNDISQRDIWEYPLNLTSAETRRLMLHVWELREIATDYYFFDENCSYLLLFLLEAARPGLHLTDQARAWVIPLDTVRLAERAGLITGTVHRPSQATTIRHLQALTTPAEQATARRLSLGQGTPTANDAPPARHALTLDLAVEALQMDHAAGRLPTADYRPRYLKLLAARSALEPPADYRPAVPAPPDPRAGHRSARLGLGAGVDDRGVPYAQLSLRPAYHDLLDPDDGYITGAEIQFLHLQARAYEEDGDLELHRVEALRILSLAPRDAFFRPLSWLVETGYLREPTDRHAAARQAYLNSGGGWAWATPGEGLAYLLGEMDLRVGQLEHDYAAGAGGRLGLYQRLGARAKLHAYLRALHYPLGDRTGRVEAGLSPRWQLSPQQALVLDLAWRATDDHDGTSAQLQYLYYF